VREAVRQNFNLTEAAKALYTSQPGCRRRSSSWRTSSASRSSPATASGFARSPSRAESYSRRSSGSCRKSRASKRVGKDYAAQDQGNLTIAATHTQARYSLPAAIAEFKKRFPKVHLSILQGSPTQVAEMVMHDQADLAIATEAISDYKDWCRCRASRGITRPWCRPDHPLLERKPITLDDLAQYPLITYDNAFAGRKKINQAFALRGLSPDIVLERSTPT
jgi:LysR family cys regulon transcriptional activator